VSLANRGGAEIQETPDWVRDAPGDAEGLEMELMTIWAGLSIEEQRHLVELARGMGAGERE
jgi:hypothetical protein